MSHGLSPIWLLLLSVILALLVTIGAPVVSVSDSVKLSDWFGFAGSIIGAMILLIAALIAWHAGQPRNASNGYAVATKSDEVHESFTRSYQTTIEQKTWIERYGQLVTASCTILVAALSLIVAISSLRISSKQQESDLSHKELLIQPFLYAVVDDINFNATITNSGLGPAKIRRVRLSFGTVCMDSKGQTTAQWTQKKGA